MKIETKISFDGCVKEQTPDHKEEIKEHREKSRISFLTTSQGGLKILQMVLTLVHAALVGHLHHAEFRDCTITSYFLYMNPSQLVAYVIEALLFLAVLASTIHHVSTNRSTMTSQSPEQARFLGEQCFNLAGAFVAFMGGVISLHSNPRPPWRLYAYGLKTAYLLLVFHILSFFLFLLQWCFAYKSARGVYPWSGFSFTCSWPPGESNPAPADIHLAEDFSAQKFFGAVSDLKIEKFLGQKEHGLDLANIA